MNPFVSFMASTAGRILRAVVGAVLLYVGLQMMAGVGGIVVAVLGVVMIAAGVFDFCLFAPLFGNPLNGSKIRAGK
jgi:hypothetical protein